jgi:acyl-CoA thioester hydrolase
VTPYPFSITHTVTFRDLDVLGHVNNAVYFTWFETARVRYMANLLGLGDPATVPIILAETGCRFHAPGQWGDTVEVGCGISRFGGKSFDMIYRVATASDRLLATGTSVLVYYDYASQRSIAVPDDFRQRVAASQGAWRAPAGET